MAKRPKNNSNFKPMPIEVDPSFARVFADQSAVMHLGRDFDVAFLTVGARLERVQRDSADPTAEIISMRPQLNEVARVRLNPNTAAVMAMEILRKLIEGGLADKAGVIDAIQALNEPESLSDVDTSSQVSADSADATDA